MITPKFTLTAGTQKILPGGRYFLIMTANQSDLTVEFLKNNSVVKHGIGTNVGAGYEAQFDEAFDIVRITAGAADVTMQVGISFDKGGYNVAQIVGAGGATLSGTPVDVTTTNTAAARLLVAANTARKRLVVLADSANTSAIRVGGSDVDGTHGVPLQAGQSVEILSTDGVYCFDNVAGQVFHFIAEYQ